MIQARVGHTRMYAQVCVCNPLFVNVPESSQQTCLMFSHKLPAILIVLCMFNIHMNSVSLVFEVTCITNCEIIRVPPHLFLLL